MHVFLRLLGSLWANDETRVVHEKHVIGLFCMN